MKLSTVCLISSCCITAMPLYGNEDQIARCNEQVKDQLYIARERGSGVPREAMYRRAMASAPYLGDERLKNILKWIGEGYAAEDVSAWAAEYLSKCVGQES